MRELREYYYNRFKEIEKRRSGQPRSTALETKFCLTDRKGEVPSPEEVQGLLDFLGGQGWQPIIDPYSDSPVGARRETGGCEEKIALATGTGQIELALVPHRDLHRCWEHLQAIRDSVRRYTGQHDLRLLCLGIQPITPPQPGVRAGARHQFWGRLGGTDQVYLLGIIADSQVHVDVSLEEITRAINVFHALSGAQIALTANSTLWCGQIDREFKDVKETFWRRWLPDPCHDARIGVCDRPFASFDDYIDTVCGMQPVFVSRDGESIGIYDYKSFADYFYCVPADGKKPDGEAVSVKPELFDIDLHDTFYWWNARISRFLTLENRCNSQQPPQEIMAPPAITLGLMENLRDAETSLQELGYSFPELAASRESAIRLGLEAEIAGDSITLLCRRMLEIAQEGLEKRGLGEEEYLSPLWRRMETGKCPADQVREDFTGGGIERIMEKYVFA